MRVTPVSPVVNPTIRPRAFVMVEKNKHTVVDNEQRELTAKEAWELHEKLNEGILV